MTSRRALLVAPLFLAACHDAGDRAPSTSPSAAPSASADAPRVDAGLPPRCVPLTTGAPADLSFGDGVELGESVPLSSGVGFAFGALRAGPDRSRVAAVVRAGGAVRAPAEGVVDLGGTSPEAPAPQPFVRGDDLYAVAYVKRAAGAPGASVGAHAGPRRALSVFHVGAASARLVDLPVETDASSAFDVLAPSSASAPVGAVIAWDDVVDVSPHPPRGVVEIATLTPDLRALRSTRVVRAAADRADGGGDAGDSGDPRLADRRGGYWLTWLARRPERAPSALPLPAGEVETPSEEATYGWVEAVALDPEGTPVGVPKRLTSATGHVASYAIAPDGASLLVVAVDEGATGRGGASLEQVIWRGEGAPDVTHLVKAGVEEETPPSLLPGGASANGAGDTWLSFLDVSGDTEVLPVPLPATAHASPTREPLLAGARLLGAVDGRMGLAVMDGARWTLRWTACTR